ncbi:hypothetical protein KXD40_009115 [Peronospora effusa]|uniref:Uncharacterized protein n=1 Tax=Peronospora effusa TaxID=542832 RepID=A0A3M6VCI7_9STRA|nr:hypothetical protein DD238_006433 [Peronospora effusa]RQM13434.1 hypothetical protein DD237_006828 [Peronospora effusa]UIZ25164.1 hypothetical protein KXD40_009115 [Peronospora effusa]CAI5702037.1 unnamed protein product [Peronospora effusa]
MPLKWFRSHRQSSTSSIEDEAIYSATKTSKIKQKFKRSKSQRFYRPHSEGPGLRAMIGLGRSMQHELDMSSAIAAEEEQRRISYQTKTHRRFTTHGFSTHHKQSDTKSPAGSPLPLSKSVSPRYANSWHHGLSSSRLVHGRSPRTLPTKSITLDGHPSIIFIDCPP